MKVRKRDGSVVAFDSNKIFQALVNAFSEENYLNGVEGIKTHEVLLDIQDMGISIYEQLVDEKQVVIDVSYIEELVQDELLMSDYPSVAKRYISYSAIKNNKREELTNIEKSVLKIVEGDKNVLHENANKDSKLFATKRDLTAGQVARAYGLRMLPKKIANAHIKGDIHWHDLDFSPYMNYSNCCLVNAEDVLRKGLNLGDTKTEEANSLQTAVNQLTKLIGNVSNSQYGGTSIPEVDKLLGRYAEKSYQKHLKEGNKWFVNETMAKEYAEEKTKNDIYDSMQMLEYEIQALRGNGNQQPFTTISFGRGLGKWEVEIQKAIFKVRIKGLSGGRTAIFPKLTFFLEDGVNLRKTDPNYEVKKLALKCASERMYPDVLNVPVLKAITGTVPTPMGCRSFLNRYINENGEEELVGRQNMGVVTINLPRIGIESNGSKTKFWEILDEKLKICKEALDIRIESVKSAKVEEAPILYRYGAIGRLDVGEDVDKLLRNGRATVSLGYIGIFETVSCFYGEDWEKDDDAKRFSLNIVKYLSEVCESWRKERGYYYSLYSTPSESLTDTFCSKDKAKFGVIKGITDKGYYNNSFHLDVRKKWNPFEKIDFEKDYPYYASGGFIIYVEYPNIKQNLTALEAVWDYAYDKVGYLGTNTPIDKCFDCGYNGEFLATERGFTCPECGNRNPETCDVVKRTCGYLGNPQSRPLNKGRQKEIVSRVKHYG